MIAHCESRVYEKKIPKALAIGIPSLGAIHMLWRNRMSSVHTPNNVNWLEFQVIGRGNAEARNELIQRVLDYNDPIIGRVERLMFIDDDVLLPPDAIVKLWQYDLPVVSGWYVIKTRPVQPLIFAEAGSGTLRSVPDEGVARCYCAGFGCTMIKREVLEAVGLPWVETINIKRKDDKDVSISVSDDVFFAKKLVERDIPWFVDYGLHCGHINTHTGEQFWWPGRGPQDETVAP